MAHLTHFSFDSDSDIYIDAYNQLANMFNDTVNYKNENASVVALEDRNGRLSKKK